MFHFITIPSKVFKSKKLPKAKPTSPYLRKAKEKLRLQGINADGNIQRVAKIICKYKGIKYLPQGQRNKTNCLVIIKEYIATKDD
uniref:Uncharacterized protein n=1 Tax=viral metagenome TaxID=1070528 RepID=A0A6M3J0J2_9ZZZZ